MGKVWDFLATDNWKEYQQVKTMKEAQNLMKEMTEKNKNLQNQLKGGNKNKGEAIKMKCPKNKNVEVFWSYSDNYLGNVCNYSGITNCSLCIKRGLYPKNKMISIISIILIILIVIDFLLLTEWGKKWIWKLVKKKITERKEIADNLLMGLLAGLLVSGVVDDNKGIFILSVILILVFIIFRGFEYKKEKNK